MHAIFDRDGYPERTVEAFRALGQSAATAAVLAIDAGSDVQHVDYASLRARLEADGQILDWAPAVRPKRRSGE